MICKSKFCQLKVTDTKIHQENRKYAPYEKTLMMNNISSYPTDDTTRLIEQTDNSEVSQSTKGEF